MGREILRSCLVIFRGAKGLNEIYGNLTAWMQPLYCHFIFAAASGLVPWRREAPQICYRRQRDPAASIERDDHHASWHCQWRGHSWRSRSRAHELSVETEGSLGSAATATETPQQKGAMPSAQDTPHSRSCRHIREPISNFRASATQGALALE